MTSPERPLCRAKTAAGQPCRNAAMRGRAMCKVHSGDSDVGRKPRLNDETIDKIVVALRTGSYRDAAAAAAGIGRSTFYGWLQRGNDDLDAGRRSPFTDLVDAVSRAEGEAELQATALIRRQMPDDWRAAAWYLERRYPDRWGRRDTTKLEHSGEVRTVEVIAPTDASRAAEIAGILSAVGALEQDPDAENTPDD